MSGSWLSDIATQLTGAIAGSSIATAHHFRNSGKTLSLIRWLSGIWFGAVTPAPLLDWLEWEKSTSNLLFMGSAIGLVAYMAIQLILSGRTKELIYGWLKLKAGVKEEVKSES